tara:strand:+ start:160 stop:333 length:174 start_codon:yes stop_codon:yes gene_type:complete
MFNLKPHMISDLKIYALNVGALATSLTNLDVVVKIIATIIAIGYTIHKWYIMYEKNK